MPVPDSVIPSSVCPSRLKTTRASARTSKLQPCPKRNETPNASLLSISNQTNTSRGDKSAVSIVGDARNPSPPVHFHYDS